MKNVSIFCTASRALVLATLLLGSAFAEVTISETTYEGRPQFVVRTPTATYYLDRAAGGFSRLLDREGNDWIAFHRNPLKDFPESAAAGYRGIPNLLFGNQNPDAGGGHPGFDQCTSHQQGRQSIVVNTQSQRWRWRWDFEDDHVTLSVLQTPPDIPYWFLYEGPVGGQWSPKTHFFGTDQGGPQRDMPANSNQLFGNWKWAYFGDDSTPRVLLVAQQEGDTLPDTLWYLGNGAKGIESQDGMIVFGFGRGPGTQPLLTGNHRFRLAFVESPHGFQHTKVAAVAEEWLASDTWQLYADDAWRGPTPAQGRDWPEGQCFFQRYWFQMGEEFSNPSVNGRFRVNDPYVATHPTFHSRSEPKGNGMLTIPVQHSLRDIEAARLYLELWGGHPHSHNRRVSINGRSTYPIHNADDNHCTHIYEQIPIRITDLVQGPNALQFAVDGERTFWGHFIVEEAAIDVLLPATSPQVQELDLSSCPQVSVNATETEQWQLSLDVSEQAATRIRAVHYFARYEGYDENGDGSRWDWHGMTKRKVPVGHLGSSTTYPFSCSWDVSMLAAQSDVAIRAIVEFQSSPAVQAQEQRLLEAQNRYWKSEQLYMQTDLTEQLSIVHPSGIVVQSLAMRNASTPFWSRADKVKSCEFDLTVAPSQIERAELSACVWDGGAGEIEDYFQFNGHALSVAGQGNHDVLYSRNPLDPSWLNPGTNSVRLHSSTEHHGIEVLYPGPELCIRYRSTTSTRDLNRQSAAFAAAGAEAGQTDWDAVGVDNARQGFAALPVFGTGPKNIDVRALQLGEIPARIYRSDASATGDARCILYFHGGGWVLGDLETHDALCRNLCHIAQATVISVAYRRAPEHSYPAAFDDCYQATLWVARHASSLAIDRHRLMLAGDSAGGNLAAAVALICRDERLLTPAGQILIYPVLDATCSLPSYQEYAQGFGLTRQDMHWFWRQYRGKQNLDAYLSPIHAASLEGLPPTLIITAECDVLRDEGESYAERLKAAGNEVTLSRYPGVIHGFVHFSGAIAEGKSAVDEIGKWIQAIAP